MKKVALICAYPLGLNPGMLSVDLAFERIHNLLPEEFQLTVFNTEEAIQIKDSIGSINYALLNNQAQLVEFDTIVFWGDFLHWIGYATKDWLTRQKRRFSQISEDELINLWYQVLLLENAPEIQKKTIIFGNSIYGLNATQLSNKRYLSALTNLYQNCRLLLLRDEQSACYATQIGAPRADTFGCDCALFLDPNTLGLQEKNSSQEAQSDRYIACSFGRSRSTALMRVFASNLARTLGLKLEDVGWFKEPQGLAGLKRKLELIRSSELVITDIYHLSVSAWREGVPAICIGVGGSGIVNTISDKKKEIFFHQIFASEYYLYKETIDSAVLTDQSFRSLLNSYANLFGNTEQTRFITSTLETQKQRCLTKIVDAIVEK